MSNDPPKSPTRIRLEIALAFPDEQHITSVEVPPGTNIIQAIAMSNIFDLFNDVPQEVRALKYGVGIFGKEIKEPATHLPKDGDRIEIYRPLLIDPKQARLNRTQRKG